MSLTLITYIMVGLTFALYIGIAFVTRASTTSEFYVANKGVHPVLNGMATAADWMSAASFISMAGLIAFLGYSGAQFLMGWTGGYVLLALGLAPYLRKFGKFTVSEFVGERYYSQTARLVAVFCLIMASITYVIGQMKGIGVAFSRFLDTSYEFGLFAGMGIVAIYAMMGGMKGITYTQVAQYVIMIFAYTIPAIFISIILTGNPVPQLGLGSNLIGSTESLLQKLDSTLIGLGFNAYTDKPISMVNMFAYTLTLMIGTAGLPHVIMRFFTVPDARAARYSAGWALVFISVLYLTAPVVGAMSRINLINTLQTGEVGDPDANMVYAERPDWIKNWETTGLLKFEDKNGDGKIQYYNDKNPAMVSKADSYGWQGNEMVKVDRDIMVLANPEIAGLPNWVIALVVAGGLAAALSTAAGLLLAISTAISHDLLKGILRPDISEKAELNAGRLAMLGTIIVAGWLGLNPPGFAAGTVAIAFGLAASTLFPILVMGVFSTRINSKGAIAGMLAGLLVTSFYVAQHKGIFFIPGTSFMFGLPQNWFFGISPNAFGVVGAVVNFIVAYVVSTRTEEVPENIRALILSIRRP